MNEPSSSSQTITIKKYANRRLYNTATSSYVTLEDLSSMVKDGLDFCVYDAKTGEDITRSVLTQIIVEEESKSGQQNLLPIGFLRNLIGYYGDNMQWMVPKYLEHSMELFSNNQDQIKSYFQNTFGSMFPFGTTLEEVSKQNLAMFERAMNMFSPMSFFEQASDDSACSCSAAKSQCDCGGANKSNVTPLNTTNSVRSTSSATNSTMCPTSFSSSSQAKNNETSSSCCSSSAPKDASSSCCCSASKPTAACSTPQNTSTTTAASASDSKTETSNSDSASSSANEMPMANTKAASTSSDADDMQTKIANLQRQLAELAKNRA